MMMSKPSGPGYRKLALTALIAAAGLLPSSCTDASRQSAADINRDSDSLVNFAHLERLGEDVTRGDSTLRIIHIYSEAPDYGWVGDDDEGIACVDDAARAAVLYLRHVELTGDARSLARAKSLLRFVMYMQRDDGLFYNFVWDNDLRINTEHPNSVADEFGWWAARGVWALGVGARVLKDRDPALSLIAAERVKRALPHLEAIASRHGETVQDHGRTYPLWLIYRYASDATSEMLMGLVSLNAAYPDEEVGALVGDFADGMALMQYGSLGEFPYGAHASYLGQWHGWGNSQTQALSQARILESAVREAESFYPRLLIQGWLHSFDLTDPGNKRTYSQIAYATRGVAAGLASLSGATGESRYAVMAGLAASWLTGNNAAGSPMYDPATGRGFDGINGPDSINRNAGAESTIEALMTLLEIDHLPKAREWLYVRAGEPGQVDLDGERVLYRVFSKEGADGSGPARTAIVANTTTERVVLLQGGDLDAFLERVSDN